MVQSCYHLAILLCLPKLLMYVCVYSLITFATLNNCVFLLPCHCHMYLNLVS